MWYLYHDLKPYQLRKKDVPMSLMSNMDLIEYLLIN